VTPIRHALRALSRSPGLTPAAIVSLALGMGPTTAIFSVTSALLLTPLPYATPDRLAIRTRLGAEPVTGRPRVHAQAALSHGLWTLRHD